MSTLKSLLIQVSLFFWFYTSVHGQLENNIWYFGTNAGLNFSTSPPTAILGSLSALEGTASICNSSGSLLFYTDGVTVWNANHLVMQNGSGILGGASSTQPALIVPIPQSCQKYYLFTTEDHMGSKTFRYSIVDMCLNGGLGGIDPAHKNVIIAINISEKLTAVMHSNGTDIWVITHVMSSNVFKVFLVDAAGIHPPVINAVGTTYTNNNYIGPVKASPSGTKIAAATTFPNHSCELFNFNKSTGVMTLSQDLQPFIANGVYGLEFSPNENFLYIATTWGTNYLYQYNLTTNAVTQLSSIAGNYNYGALQLGLDNRIYLARNNESFLGVINAPNTNGIGCNYIDNGIYLAPGSMSNSGMPNFSAYSFFQQPNNDIIADSIVNICTTGSYPVNVSLDCNASILWNTGSTSPTQNFTTPGVYTAIIQNSCNTIYDTLAIISSSSTAISLPNDTTVCGNLVTNPLTITANYTGFGSTTPTITWNTGVTAPEISITDPGTYIASITTSCGVIADTIVISEVNLPIISGPTNLVLCENTSTVLSCNVQNASNVYWSTGELGNSITVNSEGNYTIYAENACEIDSIQIVVDELQKPVLNPISSNDTCLIFGQNLIVSVSGQNCNAYTWSNGGTGTEHSFQSSGTYEVYGSNQCGIDTIQFEITINHFNQFDLPTTIDTCLHVFSFQYTISGPSQNYQWSNGQIGNTVTISDTGWIYCSIQNVCNSFSDSMLINNLPFTAWESPIDTLVFCKNSIPVNEALVTSDSTGSYAFIWDSETLTGNDNLSNSGWYIINYQSECVSGGDSIFIDLFENFSELYLPNSFTPNNDGNNDVFYTPSSVYILKVEIFNRWGQVVYSEENGFNGWNGTYENQACPDGLYQVKIVYEDCKAYRQEFVGFVALLR